MGYFHATLTKASRSLQNNENKEIVRMQRTGTIFTIHYKKEKKSFILL